MATPVLLSWSGGKDAAWTLHALRRDPSVEVVGLVTTITREYDRVAMQGIRRDLLHAQARAAGLEVVEAMIPSVIFPASLQVVPEPHEYGLAGAGALMVFGLFRRWRQARAA